MQTTTDAMQLLTLIHGACKPSGSALETVSTLSNGSAWMHEVLHGGRVSGVAQHLAILIHSIADENGLWSGSIAELAKHTGWCRETIMKYLPACRAVFEIQAGDSKKPLVIRLRLAPVSDESAVIEAAQADITTAATARALAWAVWQKTGGVCHYCKVHLNPFERHARNGFQIDHVHPQAKGGGHELSNLVPACKICNSSKRDRAQDEWGVSS